MSTKSPQPQLIEGSGSDVKKGSTWIASRTSERAVTQQAFASDPKYKKYTQQVEKCLNSFDDVHEWADCIAFLKQLLKTFQSYMQFKEIPRKLIVAKRLSQCLNPALPTGVHQRALDVYAHILAVLGSEGLQRDLPLWSSGLFPFFEYAATSVKPTLLNLYDTHYLPLQEHLRPLMKSFILALLPGLEEETGEFFDKVLSLLDRLAGTVSLPFFLQNIWLVMLTTPSARGTSLNYLSRRLPRLNSEEDITSIVGRDIGLMIRAFSAGLEDDNLLVRRGALDLLLQSMRIDSAAMKSAQMEDRTILMRSATGVVLRRDLSLNRRLYTWLLGPDEKGDHQLAYFREHTLELLKHTLKDEMFSPSGEYAESRPFKIFISLLDKWEVGAALTEVLIYDAFKAIKVFIEANPDGAEDMIMSASTLYEAVEPHDLWKQLLVSVVADIIGGTSSEGIDMVLFVLKTFPLQDEEIQGMHLPVTFSAVMDVLSQWLNGDDARVTSTSLRKSLLLEEELLRHIPLAALSRRPELSEKMELQSKLQSPYTFSCTFYVTEPLLPALSGPYSPSPPFVTALEGLIELSVTCVKRLLVNTGSYLASAGVISQILRLLAQFIARLDGEKGPLPVAMSWNPKEWLSLMLQVFTLETASFSLVDDIISLSVFLHSSRTFEPKLTIDDRPTIYKMINKLFEYLHRDCTAYHVRAVSLIWSLDHATKHSHVESILARSMTSPEYRNSHDSYEAFGVLWRLTEDNQLPGFRFKVPMMLVLDTLKCDDPTLRRIGETWMRCSLKSYLRVLDPIMYDLLDPVGHRVPSTVKVQGKELQGFLYEKQFDQRYCNHILETLLSIVRFGGQGFAKTARSTMIRRSPHPGLTRRVEAVGSHSDATYMDVLVDILLRFLKSEPKSGRVETMGPLNIVIQSTSIDLLQAIVARGEIDNLTIETMEAAVIGKLYFCVHSHRLDLQNKLLHLLHSLISASTSNLESHPIKLGPAVQPYAEGSTDDGTQGDMQGHGTSSYSVNPLLIQTLIDGVAVTTNRPLLQHWLDFVLMALPQFHTTLQAVVTPMNDCVCRQLRQALGDVLRGSADDDDCVDVVLTITDAEFVMYLNALERLILLSLANASEANQTEDESGVPEKPGQENSGLLGYMSNVFSSDNMPSTTEEQLSARSPGYRSLHEGIRVLYAVWATLIWPERPVRSSKDETLSLIYNRTRLRCRRTLEHLFRVQSAEVLESIVDCWNREVLDSRALDGAAFELMDVLIASAQNVVHMICESITCRTASSERSRKQALNPNLSDMILFKFLEQYLQRLEGPLALQVWGRFLQLAKEVVGSAREFKAQIFPVLRCLCVLADKITQTTAMEDRRIRKELQETFGKVLDSCVSFVGKSTDQGSWIRRTAKDQLGVNGRDSPAPRETKLDEKMNLSSTSLPDLVKPSGTAELVAQINEFIAVTALPHLRKFLMENDKVAAACSNIIYYIVNPALKGKARPLDIDDTTLQVIKEMTKIPSALKAWRAPVTDLINDSRVFSSSPDAGNRWRPVVKSLFDSDKTAFPELLGKVATASANIFTNREYEMLLRSMNLRRLSFVIFTGDKNHFITQLPSIQEKLVDVLRNVTAPVVQSEVFLCIRVLLCRLSPHNLTSFWPVVLTELYRIFEQIMMTLPSDGSEDLQLVLSASKVLDLLLVLQTEEFQIHQWIFITDTVDAIYRPDNWFPEAMMDQLAEIVGNLPVSDGAGAASNSVDILPTTPSPERRQMRRPLLSSLRQLDSIRDLIPFFAHVSIASYESVYTSGGSVDWEAVERGIMDDMFDAR